MKDIFNKLVLESPAAVRDIKVGGFLISGKRIPLREMSIVYLCYYKQWIIYSITIIIIGLQLTALILDSPMGKICRITRVGPIRFSYFSIIFFQKKKRKIPLLALIWQMKTLMNTVVNFVEKEDTITMTSTTSNPIEEPEALIEPCMSSAKISLQK